ncbi:MAG: methyltransferase, TIGR04325 family [Pedobacter sp.]|nr:methyltransferase, TIGR04325 family [Pedobacter sp.]MDQ8052891.1 methyltransferase, TIGR04325 family [Pedobacter sp.]
MIKIIKALTPPVVFDVLKKLFGQKSYGFSGNYKTWAEAKSQTGGYDNPAILEQVKIAALKIKSGEAVYERDSVLFDQIQYSWPLLSGLLWIAAQKKGNLSVLDFGGALGSTYFQNRTFISDLYVTWDVVEQHHFVEFGKKELQDGRLSFFYTIEDCLKEHSPSTLLLSGVIQYLEEPFKFLTEALDKGFEYILLDRTPFANDKKNRITIQEVSPEIYAASYAHWFFSEDQFLNLFKGYDLIESFTSIDRQTEIYYKGFIFKKRCS